MTQDDFEIQPFLDKITTSLMHKFIVANSANIYKKKGKKLLKLKDKKRQG